MGPESTTKRGADLDGQELGIGSQGAGGMNPRHSDRVTAIGDRITDMRLPDRPICG